jgi:NAD(P)-dependent dehydrogenase (short-subunit alcohol dehydrogenase family)
MIEQERAIAVVTGASRGVGRGIARALGETGAVVYVTGRSTGRTSGRAGHTTIDSVAEEITAAGGTGVPVAVDHRDDTAVAALFARVAAESGRLDLLVNNAFGTPSPWVAGGGFWEHPIDIYGKMHDVGVRSSYVAAWHACKLMVPQQWGAIVNVSSRAAQEYLFSTAYGIGKAATDKLTADLAHELREHNVCVVSVWPDLARTEFYEQQVAAGVWPARDDAQDPVDVGRAVLALLGSPAGMARSGTAIRIADLLPLRADRRRSP